jgi:predicted nucleotidyltransferase
VQRDPVEAARAFVAERFPDAHAAIVGGSPIRGDATATSDLDIVILTDRPEAPFRASYREQGWPIEVFVHTDASLQDFFTRDAERLRPSLLNMAAEGVILVGDNGAAKRIQDAARARIERGPNALTAAQLEDWRYSLTDLLDDFVGADRFDEGMFIANDLAVEAAGVLLLMNRRWLGNGKWILRALRRFDPSAAHRLADALEAYYRREDKGPLVRFAEAVLDQAGGRLFEGYYREAPK